MSTLTLTLRLVLAALFLGAAIAKLADPVGSRQTLADFEVPARFRRQFALGLPSSVLVVGALLFG